jgi:hypothetical protein
MRIVFISAAALLLAVALPAYGQETVPQPAPPPVVGQTPQAGQIPNAPRFAPLTIDEQTLNGILQSLGEIPAKYSVPLIMFLNQREQTAIQKAVDEARMAQMRRDNQPPAPPKGPPSPAPTPAPH